MYSGWIADIAKGTKAGITSVDWLGLILISVVLPAILTLIFHKAVKRAGWVKAGDQKL